MAELLVMARDQTNPDPVINARCLKRGSIVAVKPDHHTWGMDEGLPDFYIVRITGKTVDRVNQFGYQDSEPDILDPRLIVRKRRYAFNWNTIPQAAKDILDLTGRLTIGPPPGSDYTWTQFKQHILDQKTGLVETRTI